jgi:hypothetical protein
VRSAREDQRAVTGILVEVVPSANEDCSRAARELAAALSNTHLPTTGPFTALYGVSPIYRGPRLKRNPTSGAPIKLSISIK